MRSGTKLSQFLSVFLPTLDAFVGLFCGRDCFGWVDILFVIFTLAGDHLHGKWLSIWLSLVVTNFVLSFITVCFRWDEGLHCSAYLLLTRLSY